VRTKVVDRVVGRAIEEHGYEPAADFVGAAFSGWNVADASHSRKGRLSARDLLLTHASRCTIVGMPSASPTGPIRLVVLDVDGTVTDSRHQVTEAACRAVARMQAAGVRVMLATGRRYRDTLPIAAQLAITEPLVTASGGLVKRPADHATLHRAGFAPGILELVLATLVAKGHEPVVYTDSFADGYDFYCRGLPDAGSPAVATGFTEYLYRNRTMARVVPELHLQPPAEAFAAFAMGGEAVMKALEADLRSGFPDQLSLHTIRSPRYADWLCEIAPEGVSKWSGILGLAAAWGIGPAEICAVGDDVNDLPMVRGAGLGIAMGNGRPELRQEADRVVGTHDAGGMLDVADLVLASLAQPA
jgi:Cof subfamily protein (haloacid dehalogenase superfamily)